jgi:hypothetical protein
MGDGARGQCLCAVKSTRAEGVKKAEATVTRRLPLCLLDVDIKNYVRAANTHIVSLNKNNMRAVEMRKLGAAFPHFFSRRTIPYLYRC